MKPKSKIEIYISKKNEENSLIVFSGGNNIIKFSSTLADKFRYKPTIIILISQKKIINIKILVFVRHSLSYKFGAI